MRPGNLPLAVLSGLVTAALFVIAVGGVYETWAFATGHWPITHYFRAAIHTYPPVAFIVAVVIGMVIGHLFWK